MTLIGRVILEHGPGGSPALFEAPREVVVAWERYGVVDALSRLDALRGEGLWVAGWIAYEAAAAFEPRLEGIAGRDEAPLLVMAAFDEPVDVATGAVTVGPLLTAPEPVITREAYGEAIDRILAYVAAGDCYQVNMTFPMRARLADGATPLALYERLLSGGPVGHAAFVDLGTGSVVVSLSPELFVRIDADGSIEARPMKGTAPRDPDPMRDAALAAELLASEKARAENLMIVDLLRNDISRLCEPGSVRVPDLFRIEPYATVHQMTSTVTGRLAHAPTMATLMAALFPCGSVTGAPKIRAMEIIRELEPHPRGVYCGAIGWMAPDGRADFSVAIRTLSIESREVTVSVGGGIVADSTPQGEWEEALWKARFLAPAIVS